MRILNEATHEVGHRVARVLLAQPEVTYVGLWRDEEAGNGARSGPASDASGFDIAVTDRTEGFDDLAARAAVEGIPLVLWGDVPDLADGPTAAPIVTAANVGTALTAALQHHPVAQIDGNDSVTTAWTEPGAPLRNGHPLAFPEPVGMSWGIRRGDSSFVAFRDDHWGGAVLRVTGPQGDRVIGAADHAAHLEALVLAASAFATLEAPLGDRTHSASELGERLMNKLRMVELDFAVWRSSV